MTICLDVTLVAGRYDAADGQDPRVEEWPPHPARVFSALRSVADAEDLEVLRLLERLPAPTIHASGAMASGNRAYVVTNVVESKGGNLAHPGRTSGMRERRSAHPTVPRVQFLWPEPSGVSDDMMARLDALAAQVPYLGRSTSVVMMGVRRVNGSINLPEGLDSYVPSTLDESTLRVRVPYDGYTDELNALHESGLPAWQASDGGRAAQPYRRVTIGGEPVASDEGADATPYRSPYRDLIVLNFADHRPDGRHINDLTAALRSHVMGQTADPLPPALHGHGFDGQPHVAYLALPFAGSQHADGRLMGLALAIPSMDEQDRRHIIRGVLGIRGDAEATLNVPRLGGRVRLVYRPNQTLPWATNVETWTRASRQWVTATPIVLDRYPKDGDLAAAVMRSVTLAGLPKPRQVEVSREAMTQGAVRLQPKDLPRRARGRLYCHARVTFDRPVAGPVLVGAGRYFGVGLLQPEQFREASHSHAG